MMSSKGRTELLNAIAELGNGYPHWRFGQLIANVAGWCDVEVWDVEVWDVEDEQLLAAAKAHLEQLAEREKIKS